MTLLGERTWPEVGTGAVLALPVGSCEQHGPHLPLATDTLVATELAGRLAARRTGRVLAGPALPYGASGEHAAFPGTLSVGTAVLTEVLVELVRSADHFAGVVVVSAHGGNAAALAGASARCADEGRRVLAWSPRQVDGGDAHAGWVETSALLHLAPQTVRSGRAAGDRRPLAELLPALRAGGVAAVSANGVLGDPAGATAERGAALLDAWADDLVAAFDRWVG
ncbi:MAG TPA: mycofactocin biosynthesis peptidyl-dipeptidase MftE [Acidimicrobiales bacterium]|nr:mycofactocin biosynthesis peptidyl-dipeptidase MftE [Acidimicrobiales bacterium]